MFVLHICVCACEYLRICLRKGVNEQLNVSCVDVCHRKILMRKSKHFPNNPPIKDPVTWYLWMVNALVVTRFALSPARAP